MPRTKISLSLEPASDKARTPMCALCGPPTIPPCSQCALLRCSPAARSPLGDEATYRLPPSEVRFLHLRCATLMSSTLLTAPSILISNLNTARVHIT
ncbi:uncharacterized protein SCHCODRAFT_02707108 [Schizophyllum commune H4-8]|uniref:uncharacterized protein n=1 Tax=Schizophyllum commune (strain H4-8 / FGSC 9210) TaxID=578458 RepID=UPI00215E4F39|nr:uncharacterized protein SCHCODRAFT_02707108 [Schizophyllum commune H4-8]KAI5885198.1 hypothetical protein SCHCODRAFT_02707108 [Schizophyllum commune H4-8]